MAIQPKKVAGILGGERELHRSVRTLRDLREAVSAGLPLSALERTAEYIGRDEREARKLKDRIVPRTTRYRREKLKPEESERLERLARTVALAEDVWESRDDAHEFLASPQPTLENRTPLELAESELGAREVEELLMKLEYGLPV